MDPILGFDRVAATTRCKFEMAGPNFERKNRSELAYRAPWNENSNGSGGYGGEGGHRRGGDGISSEDKT